MGRVKFWSQSLGLLIRHLLEEDHGLSRSLSTSTSPSSTASTSSSSEPKEKKSFRRLLITSKKIAWRWEEEEMRRTRKWEEKRRNTNRDVKSRAEPEEDGFPSTLPPINDKRRRRGGGWRAEDRIRRQSAKVFSQSWTDDDHPSKRRQVILYLLSRCRWESYGEERERCISWKGRGNARQTDPHIKIPCYLLLVMIG